MPSPTHPPNKSYMNVCFIIFAISHRLFSLFFLRASVLAPSFFFLFFSSLPAFSLLFVGLRPTGSYKQRGVCVVRFALKFFTAVAFCHVRGLICSRTPSSGMKGLCFLLVFFLCAWGTIGATGAVCVSLFASEVRLEEHALAKS